MFEKRTKYDQHHQIISDHLSGVASGILYLRKKEHPQDWLEASTIDALENMLTHLELAQAHLQSMHKRCGHCKAYVEK